MEDLIDPLLAGQVRTSLHVLEIAAGFGWSARRWVDKDRLKFDGPMGGSWVVGMVTLDDSAPVHELETRKAMLVDALDVAFAGRRYGLWLRKALLCELDTAAITRAVTLWLAAIDRGEWSGVHAVYEDTGVSFELVLLDGTEPTQRGPVLIVNPLGSLDRLNSVDHQLVDLVSRHEQRHGDLPLVVAVGSLNPYTLADGFTRQLLYGTPDWVTSNGDGMQYAFPGESRSLFADPVMASVGTIWWISPSSSGPLDFTTRSHENPWSLKHEAPEPVSGARFCAVGMGEGSRGRSVTLMSWETAGGET